MNNIIKDNNFVYIKNFISPQRAFELAKSFKECCIQNAIHGDDQAENSHAAYNYIGFLELLCEKTPEVSKFLGETVLPTYTYARIYKEGSDLKKHKDRPACEISLTLHLSGDAEWPIFIEKPNGEEVSLNLGSGDAMLYLGCEAEHWREQFKGKEYIQVFLHYVRSRGPNNFAFFDNKDPNEKKILMDSEKPVLPESAPLSKKQYSRNLDDYIKVFDDIIPDDLCYDILKEYGNSEHWAPALVGGKEEFNTIDRRVRNLENMNISLNEIISCNPEIRKELDIRIFKCAEKAISMYKDIYPLAQIEEDSGYELLRYSEGSFYTTHTDSFKHRPRAVSCSFALNDDYEGGEFAFFNQDLKYKLKKGSVIMFPSNFMYPHEILPVTKGVRYSIITWFV